MFSEECAMFNNSVHYYKKGLLIDTKKFTMEIERIFPKKTAPLGYAYKPISSEQQETPKGFTVEDKLNQIFETHVYSGLVRLLNSYTIDKKEEAKIGSEKYYNFSKYRDFQKFLVNNNLPHPPEFLEPTAKAIETLLEYYGDESSGAYRDMEHMYKNVKQDYISQGLTPTIEEVNSHINQNAFIHYGVCNKLEGSAFEEVTPEIVGKIFDYVNSYGESVDLSS